MASFGDWITVVIPLHSQVEAESVPDVSELYGISSVPTVLILEVCSHSSHTPPYAL